MNRMLARVVVFTAAAVVLGCSKDKPRAARPADLDANALTASHVDGSPVITRLVGRDTVVTVTSGPDGPRYSAATKAGEVLVSGVTLDELRTHHPDVYRFVQPAVALESTADNRGPKAAPLADAPQARFEPFDAESPTDAGILLPPEFIDASHRE